MTVMQSEHADAVPVSWTSLERLLALYHAGYMPESLGLHDQAAALGWHGAAGLDRLFSRWPLTRIVLPDGTQVSWDDIDACVDWAHAYPVRIGGVILAPRRNRFAWWTGWPVS